MDVGKALGVFWTWALQTACGLRWPPVPWPVFSSVPGVLLGGYLRTDPLSVTHELCLMVPGSLE